MLHAVGGLAAIGFDQSSRYLMVVSSAGRGVYDCHSGERVARDQDDSWSWYRDDDASCEGFGPLLGMRIPMYGTGGQVETQRVLPLVTADGFACVHSPMRDPGCVAIVMVREGKQVVRCEVEIPRAFGFSHDHRTLVIAEPHTLTLVRRGPQ